MSRTRGFDADANVSEKLTVNGDTEECVADGCDDGDESDEEETVEESPCGRWLKRREEVHQRNVPGIDNAFLAMDSEEGVEVVWNEISFSEEELAEGRDVKLRKVFDYLIQLEHQNIVKFHKYWVDKARDPPRLVFISEYMSSGSLKQFMKKTKSNLKRLPLQSWKRWCTQIVSALNFLHSRSPPIIHGNLSCDTIFIQHNGLVKIGSVAPDVINEVVRTSRDVSKNRHFIAPEYAREDGATTITSAVDIYSFGMCALEMAVLEIQSFLSSNGAQSVEGSPGQMEEGIRLALETLGKEEPLQYEFIQRCLKVDPAERTSARELLFHPMLFEVHSLKLLAAHCLVHSPEFTPECVTEEAVQQRYGRNKVVAEVKSQGEVHAYPWSYFPAGQKLESFMEDVQFGMYPLTAFAVCQSDAELSQSQERPASPCNEGGRTGTSVNAAGVSTASKNNGGSAKGDNGHPSSSQNESSSTDGSPSKDAPGHEPETRRVLNMVCSMRTSGSDGDASGKAVNTDGNSRVAEDGSPFALQLSLLLRLEDKMNRQLVCDLKDDDTAESLAADLVRNCLISKDDETVVRGLVSEMMENLATGCTSSASAILDRTDIPASFFESGLMKDLIAAATVTVGGTPSVVPAAGRVQNALPNSVCVGHER